MRTRGIFSALILIVLTLGAGCGGDKAPAAPKTPAVTEKAVGTKGDPALVDTTPGGAEGPAGQPNPVRKGLGLSQAELLKGISDQITLEQADMKTAEGNVYMGNTPDGGDKFTKLVVYGTPAVVTHAYFTAALPYADFADAKYPDFMLRNIKLQETFVANLFGATPPAEIKDALEWARANPDKDKTVTAAGKTAKFQYSQATKKITIDVK